MNFTADLAGVCDVFWLGAGFKVPFSLMSVK